MLTLQIREGKDFWWNSHSKKLHRLDRPAHTSWYENGRKQRESYNMRGKIHRRKGPALIYYHSNGQKASEFFCINEILHREDGPAFNSWYEDGKKRNEDYYLDGVCCANFTNL